MANMEIESARKREEFAANRVHAALRLAFERDDTKRQTILTASKQEPPLRIVRAFSLDDGAALVHLHNVSGGLLGGDQLALSVHIGNHAWVQITTTGATRVYRRREEAQSTSQCNEFFVGEHGLLEYLPDPVIPFAGARFSQKTSIQLAVGAGLFWWEILTPGREARGETFQYESLELRTDVDAMDGPIAIERVLLEPNNREMSSLARLGPYRTWATFYICHVGLEPAAWIEVEREMRKIAEQFGSVNEALWGISTLPAHGLVVRCLAVRGHTVLPGMQALWRAAKLRLYGCEAVPPRKMN